MSIVAVPEDVRWRPHPKCSKPHALWSAPDKDATEVEVTAFVAALVRLTKPFSVVETGTYRGHTTSAIAEALSENGPGVVHSYETDRERSVTAYIALREHVDAGRVILINETLTAANCPRSVELAFLDSAMNMRQADMNTVWSNVVPGGIVLVHDASPDRPPGRVRPPDRFAMFDFATPRGLYAFQKPWA